MRTPPALIATLCLLCARAPWAAAPAPAHPNTGEAAAARFCRPIQFIAYSTVEPSGERVEESIRWDANDHVYVVRGPVLARLLDYPGSPRVPDAAHADTGPYKIVPRVQPSPPIDRFCQDGFQEAAQCDAHGDVDYTQIYTDCELQRLAHVVRLTPDSAGNLPLLAVRIQDVQGRFGDPLYLSAGTDLRLRVRN